MDTTESSSKHQKNNYNYFYSYRLTPFPLLKKKKKQQTALYQNSNHLTTDTNAFHVKEDYKLNLSILLQDFISINTYFIPFY